MKRLYRAAPISRRHALAAMGAASVSATIPLYGAQANVPTATLTAGTGIAPLMGDGRSETDVWAFNHMVPGPLIKIPQGESVHIKIKNALQEPTTVHWHGIRLDNAMDGVPHMTQDPIPPGGVFDYKFTAPDAGTYWYHSHFRSWEQVARGLSGVLIVEEKEPPIVDSDRLFVADDWRLTDDGQIAGDFGHMRDASHGGRMGNWLTVNGRTKPTFKVQQNERVRLRCVSTANARVMAFDFSAFDAYVVAIDGQPLPTIEELVEPLVLAPAQRADLLVDIAAKGGDMLRINEISTGEPLVAAEFVVDPEQQVRARPLNTEYKLAANPLPALDPNALDMTVPLVMEGGAMGSLRNAKFNGKMFDLRSLVMEHGKAWAFNGTAGGDDAPLFTARIGQTVAVEMTNDTRWQHAMHIHGHHFRVISKNGSVVTHSPLRDTELMQPGDKVTIAFVADNPGKWLLHCHMLAHHMAGMGTWFNVTI